MGIQQDLTPKEIGKITYPPQHVTLCIKKTSKCPKGTIQMSINMYQ